MKIFFISLLAVFVSGNLSVASEKGWNITKSTHFVIYFKSAPESFIKQLTDKAEGYYDNIAEGLGFRRFDFWLWDNRAKIYIYDDARDYQSSTGQPAWSGGSADIKEKEIKSFFNAQGFFETTLPHEMGHIIFREFVGFDNQAVPIWLDEGVASYQEKVKYSGFAAFIKDAESSGKFEPLKKLSAFNPKPSVSNEEAEIFYVESYSIIDFLINKFDKESFVIFCENLRDKKDLEGAITSAYHFKNIADFEEGWRKYLSGL